MKKILHINPQLEDIGGMEKYIEIFYSTFSSIFYNYVLTFYKGKNNTTIDDKLIFSLNEKKKKNNIFHQFFLLFYRSIKISKICKDKNIDFSISHGEVANILNIVSKLFNNKAKIIIIIHNAINKENTGYINLFLVKILYKFADKIIFISKEQEYNLSKELKLKINSYTTIYNPISLNKSIKKYNRKINNEIIFGVISRIDQNKNIISIINNFNHFYQNNKQCKLWIIGGGPELSSIKQYITHLESNTNIVVYGFQKNINTFLEEIDYLLSFSLSEGFGRILIESLNCNVPILSHDYKYGAKEIIRNNNNFTICEKIEIHENGILCPYLDNQSYIQGMSLIVNHEFNLNKIQNNIQKYSVENFKNYWNNILK